MKPVFALFNITTEIFDDNIVEFINNNIDTEILVNGIMKIAYDDDQLGYLIVKFSSTNDLESFLIAWRLVNSYKLRYIICRGKQNKIHRIFHVEEINE